MSAVERFICVGSYTEDVGGRGPGITTYWQDPATGALSPSGALRLVAPSYLAWHPSLPVLYAVNELDDGMVTAVECDDDGELCVVETRTTGGSAPCHLAVSTDGAHLLVANYGGSVAAFPLDPQGGLGQRTDLIEHHGSGPDASRQHGAHVHMIVPRDGSVETVDLGTDEIRGYRLSAEGRLDPLTSAAMPSGTGPRQLVHFGGRHYLLGELDSTLRSLDEIAPGEYVVSAAVAATMSDRPNLPAQLCVTGSYVYVSNRGADTVAVFGLDLDPLGEYPSGGQWPRHMSIIGDHLYVANQNDDTVAVHAIDRAAGALTLLHSYSVGSPACVVARPDQ